MPSFRSNHFKLAQVPPQASPVAAKPQVGEAAPTGSGSLKVNLLALRESLISLQQTSALPFKSSLALELLTSVKRELRFAGWFSGGIGAAGGLQMACLMLDGASFFGAVAKFLLMGSAGAAIGFMVGTAMAFGMALKDNRPAFREYRFLKNLGPENTAMIQEIDSEWQNFDFSVAKTTLPFHAEVEGKNVAEEEVFRELSKIAFPGVVRSAALFRIACRLSKVAASSEVFQDAMRCLTAYLLCGRNQRRYRLSLLQEFLSIINQHPDLKIFALAAAKTLRAPFVAFQIRGRWELKRDAHRAVQRLEHFLTPKHPDILALKEQYAPHKALSSGQELNPSIYSASAAPSQTSQSS